MYLRFRSKSFPISVENNTFEELFRQIHGRPPKRVNFHKPSRKIQIYLVKNQRINGKPRQIHIGTLGNFDFHFDDADDSGLKDEFWSEIKTKLDALKVPLEKQLLLIRKIESYLTAENLLGMK